MTGGDFTQDAYQQLREAYADSLSTQEEQEQAGREILGQKMTLETMPVDSPWRDKIKDWQYPNGKSEYLDGKQSPEEILEVMRQSVMEKKTADEEAEELSEQELDAMLDEILGSDAEEDEEETDEEEDSEVVDEAVEEAEEQDEDEEEEAVDLSGLSEEEITAWLAENPEYELVQEEEEDEVSDEEPEAVLEEVEEEEAEAEEEYDEEEEEVDPEVVASQIAELKEQIESFRFSNISDEDVEE